MLNHNSLLKLGASLVAIEPGWSAGFFIREDLILTAGHCLRDRPTVLEIHTRTGEVIWGRIVAIDSEVDIGLISVPRERHKATPLSFLQEPLIWPLFYFEKSPISLGVLMKETNHNGHPFEVEYGHYIGDTVVPGWETDLHHLKVYSRKGFSGAPIIHNDQVCGMLVAGNDWGEVFAVPSKYLQDFIFRKA